MSLKIKVLLWKSFKLRKRRWICTTMEIIIPCLLFLIIPQILPESNNSIKKSMDQSIPSPISDKDLAKIFILYNSNMYFIYTPKTLETEQIMKSVAISLGISVDKIDTAINEGEMINKFNSSHNNGFGIVFEEVIKELVFKYKIRSTHDGWETDLLFPWSDEPGPMNSGEKYLRTGFLTLQLFLDFAFINLNNDSSNGTQVQNDYNFKIQSYPYELFETNSPLLRMIKYLQLFTVLGFLFMCLQTIKQIVEEKDSGIKELMKMMGLKTWMIWTGWILHNIILYVIPITAITYLPCFGINKILIYSNLLTLWIFLFMFVIAGVFFCFAISSLFNQPLVALVAGFMAWLLSFIIPQELLEPKTSIFIKTLSMLLPNTCVIHFFDAVSYLENAGIGLQFSSIFTSGNHSNSISVGFVLFMFIVDCFLYGFIAWYLDSVMPGKYGIGQRLNFLCKWSKSKTKNEFVTHISTENSKLFEKPPRNYEVGISVKNLHKKFRHFHAVRGVNLDLYKGQITALLGHNGAGKTTTMSIITGI